MKVDYKYFIVKYFPIIRHRYAVYAFFKSVFSFLRVLPGSSIHFGPPRGFYLTANQYNAINKNNPIEEYYLSAEARTERELPETNSDLVVTKWQGLTKKIIAEKKGFILSNARYFSGYAGTVVTSDDKIFIPCSPLKNAWQPHQHDSLYKLKLPNCRRLKKVVVIDTKGAQSNYGHWLRDHLSRFYWLKKMNINLSDYTLVSTFSNTPYQKFSYEVMKTKGFNFEKFISTEDIKHFRADVVVVPPNVNPEWDSDHYSYDVNESTIFLKSIFLEDKTDVTTYDRIYISRRRSRRSSPQEAELVEKLAQFGVTEIFLEDYNVSQQAALFYSASLIIGFHGSGFANLYFCKSETTVVEIFAPDYLRTDFWDEAEITGVRYFAYTEEQFKQDLSSFRLAIQVPTYIDVNKFIDFCKSNNLLPASHVYTVHP